MKVLAIIACVAVFSGPYVGAQTEAEKKDLVLKFYKCLACSDNADLKKEYAKCDEMKSEKCKNVANDCENKIMPEATTAEERLKIVCKNDFSQNEKIYDCIMNDERIRNISDVEEAQSQAYLSCINVLVKKYCDC